MRRIWCNLLRGAGSMEIWPMLPRRQPPSGPEGLHADWLAVGMQRQADSLTPDERARFLEAMASRRFRGNRTD